MTERGATGLGCVRRHPRVAAGLGVLLVLLVLLAREEQKRSPPRHSRPADRERRRPQPVRTGAGEERAAPRPVGIAPVGIAPVEVALHEVEAVLRGPSRPPGRRQTPSRPRRTAAGGRGAAIRPVGVAPVDLALRDLEAVLSGPVAIPASPSPPRPRAPAEPATRASAPARRTLWRLRAFVAPHRGAVLAGLVLLLVGAGLDLLKPWPLKYAFDEVIGQGPLEGRTFYVLVGLVAAVVALEVLSGLTSYVLVLVLNRAGRKIVLELRAAVFDTIQRLSLQDHSRRSTGDLLTRVTSDAKAVRDVLTESIAEILSSAVVLIGMAGVLLVLDWQLALIAIGATPLIAVLLRRFSFRIREHSRAERAREGALASVAHETLGTVRIARIFGREREASERFRAENVASLESGYAAAVTQERFAWVVDVLTALVLAAVLWVGVQHVLSDTITIGTLIVFVSYTRNFFKPLRSAIKQGTRISRAAPRIERVADLLDAEPGVRNLRGARPAPAFRGHIELRDVCLDYGPGHPALERIDLVVPAGVTTAIIGPTGAGKTSLASLIPRLYDPVRGTVTIDGADVRRYTLESLRAQISMVLQEPVLVAASVRENIAYGRPSASFREIVSAARAAGAHEFVEALPDGYETLVGERGETLSGGERQRIAIARALVRDAPIVILDEPLAGLDAATAEAVWEGVRGLLRGRTLIVITHDLATVDSADHVVVLAEGRVVQVGSPHQLLRADGRYRRLLEVTAERGRPEPSLEIA